jgi:AcrR family transcriptional regulator
MTSPVRARILAAAVQLFAVQGFDATSVQEIVERAEVTKGALYHYFGAKDDLLYEIYHSLIGTQLADLDTILARGLPPDQSVRAVITDLVETTAARVEEATVFAREMHKLDADRMAAVRADRRRYHEAFRAVVATAQADGTFATPASAETVTLVVFGMVNQLPTWYRPGGPRTPAQIGGEVADFVLAALRN